MAYNLGALVTKVQQRVRDTGFSSSQIADYINDTQYDIFNEYKLPFMEDNADFTMSVGSSDISGGAGMPTNYVLPIDIYITTSGKEKLLPRIDVSELDQYHADPTDTTLHQNGLPQYWYVYGNSIKVYPSPDDAYTATLRYYKRPTELSSNDDVPEVPVEFGECLVTGASYRVLQVKDNYDQAGIVQNKYDEILQKMVFRYSEKQSGKAGVMRINRRRVSSGLF